MDRSARARTVALCLAAALLACASPDDEVRCEFGAAYDYGSVGGMVPHVDRSMLEGVSWTRTRKSGSTTTTCSPTLPACGVDEVIDVADVERALAAPEVSAAFDNPTPPLFGRDNRPADGAVFELRRADGRGFTVGDACSSGSTQCADAPAGVAAAVKLLRDLDAQQIASPECAALR